MRILILNWRDIRNPRAGGAELLTHEISKRWVAAGNTVTIFSERPRGAASEEVIDGVTVIRRGRWWNVHFLAMMYYFFRFRTSTDVIIDEVHWYPFFSVLYARKKVVLLVCEVARRIFSRLFPYPVAVLWQTIEQIYFFLYRNTSILAISPSTKRDLLDEGIPERNITVLPMGLTVPKMKKHVSKEKLPMFLYVGRIHPLKGVIDAVEAMAIICEKLPQSKLWIIGAGDASYVETLKIRIKQLHLTEHVDLLGFVSEVEKYTAYQRAHLLLAPSVQEGWGLTISEAASQGTPSIGYDTAGLRDVVEHNVSGILTARNTPEALAEEVLKLFEDKKKYRQMQYAGIQKMRKMSWDITASTAMKFIKLKN